MYEAPAGIRVWVLVVNTHVDAGATWALKGANGPEGRRNCTVTASGVVPGFSTSISDEPPPVSRDSGMVQPCSGAAAPGTIHRPAPVVPEAATCSTSEATNRPVRADTTVLTDETCCTSDATFSTTSCPGLTSRPW